jgi:hypothetical protein
MNFALVMATLEKGKQLESIKSNIVDTQADK